MSKKDELVKIVGEERVDDAPGTLRKYSRDESFVNSISPDYVVKPGGVKDVQAIVKWANTTLTPLVAISSGPPRFRGDTVPGAGGSVIVDLSTLKGLLRIDRRNRVVMVEPGVTFAELIPELAKEGLRLNTPLLPRQSKSVVASALEREPVIMPKYHWDISDPLCCVEVVFGTGDLFRTGTAAGPGTLEEQWKAGAAQKGPHGPAQFDPHRLIQGAQGTMGIVTWATLRCESTPKLQVPYLVGSSSLDSLLKLNHWLIRRKLVDECLILSRHNLATIVSRNGEYESLLKTMPRWVLFFCVSGYEYFPEERVAYQEDQLREIAKQLGLEPVKALGGVSADEIVQLLGNASGEPYWKLRRKGGCYDVFFLATQERIEEFLNLMEEIAYRHEYSAQDIGVYLQPVVQNTGYHCELNLFFDPENPAEVTRVQSFSTRASEALMARGAFFARPYGPWADMVYMRDGVTTSALKKVKEVFDPNNILNPGKLCF